MILQVVIARSPFKICTWSKLQNVLVFGKDEALGTNLREVVHHCAITSRSEMRTESGRQDSRCRYSGDEICTHKVEVC